MAFKHRSTRLRSQRRWRMTRAYCAPGADPKDVARRFGITEGALKVNMHRWGVKLPEDERRRRVAESNRRSTESRIAPLRVWPDCPEHLREDYETLRKYMRAGEARATLEGQAP